MSGVFDRPPEPLGAKLAPVLRAGQRRGPCPSCHEVDWWERPDGTAICGHCVRHTAAHGPNSNGDYRWCPQCNDGYWVTVKAKQDKELAAPSRRRRW